MQLTSEIVARSKNSWMPTQVTHEEEEQEWERLFNTSHVREGLRRLAAEAQRQFAAGETEEGGFAVE